MRIVDVSPHADNVDITTGGDYQSVSGKALCIACSPDGGRVYLGGQSGVWTSNDGGLHWRHMERPQPPQSQARPPGALPVTNVYDLWVHPENSNVVVAAVGRDYRRPEAGGLYRSTDGGSTWSLAHDFLNDQAQPQMVSMLAGAPGQAGLVYAAGGVGIAVSANGGQTWEEDRSFGSFTTANHVLVGPASGSGRRIYVFGSSVAYSVDGGVRWLHDSAGPGIGTPADAVGESSRAASLHPTNPRVVYVRKARRVGDQNVEELWKGEFPVDDGPGTWALLPNPPIGYPGTTASGCSFVLAHHAPDGQLLLIVSDRRTTHLAVGEPTDQSAWQRIDGNPVHVDPHGIAASRDFRRSTSTQMGRLHLISDGGAYVSTDGARTWAQGKGLSTLGLVNAAVLSVDGQPKGICIQMGDNSGFYSRDGGQTWRTQDYLGGDNDCTFADPRQPNRLIVFAPRAGRREVFVYVDPSGGVPDASIGTTQRHKVKGPPLPAGADEDDKALWIAVSSFFGAGYRPLVLTLADEQPRPGGDFVTIWNDLDRDRSLLLRSTALSSVAESQDWVTTATAEGPGVKVFQQGPDLPFSFDTVQPSGGHARPTFTVSESSGQQRLQRWTSGMSAWAPIVPALGNGPRRAERYFVDPYRPQLLYVLDTERVWRTDDGGGRWVVDSDLERVLTRDGFSFDQRGKDVLLRDMAFDPRHPYRFAVGPRGIFHTLDGITWAHLALSSALGAQLNNVFYDPGDTPCDRSLYVATSARGLLRLHPLPPEWDTPLGSINAAVGRISVLRMHELGTGFGPPTDRLDTEVVVQLDTEPGKAFGFRLREDGREPMARGQLDQLRDVFKSGRQVRIEYERTGCRTGTIVRVIQP